MDREHLKAFAQRDWPAIARSKRAHQVRIFREQGAAAAIRVARALFAHARALDPQWPPVREREADLRHHVELNQAFDRVAQLRTQKPSAKAARDGDRNR